MNPFMREAIALAVQAVDGGHGGPFGAVVVKDGAIIGRGHNRVVSGHDPTAHAEMEAIRDACARQKTFHLKGAEIYTTCEPCPMCLAAIYWAQIGTIHYGSTREDAAAIGFADKAIYDDFARPMEGRLVKMVPLMRDQTQAVFQRWQDRANRIVY